MGEAGLAFTLALSAWFSGAETVFLTFSRPRLLSWEREGNRGARKVLQMSHHPERFFSTVLIGNNLAVVGFSSLAAVLLSKMEVGAAWALVLPPAAVLIFGEVIPKVFAQSVADRAVTGVTEVMRIIRVILYPVAQLVELAALGLTGRGARAVASVGMSRADITSAVRSAARAGVIEPEESLLMLRMFGLAERRVKDLMTPRPQVASVSLDDPPAKVWDCLVRSGHTRLPVCRKDVDDVVGYVDARDVLRGVADLKHLIRPLFLVPDSMRVIRLLREFRLRRVTLAGVVDEYGGLAGLITLDDVVQELVGSASVDAAGDPHIRKISRSVYLAKGNVRVARLEQMLGVKFGATPARSVGGLVTALAGGIPKPGAQVRKSGVTFRVLKATPKGVELVRIAVDRPEA